jgi:1-deoxy-D-xylulose-5-phosphate reductoisomerase
MKDVVLLGATGSVGRQALDVLRELSGSFRITGLSGNSNLRLLADQAREFQPRSVAVATPPEKGSFSSEMGQLGAEVLTGPGSLDDLIRGLKPDIVLQAVSGAAGLRPSLTAIEEGARLALANKESLVMAGHILMPLAVEKDVEIVPVDSEHSAIFQALAGRPRDSLRRIFLTASGGPFVDWPAEEIRKVTPAQALKHPTWDMGSKISIDSATMMNKALEIIEARWLFDCMADKIEIVVHRQSIVHSMVEFNDGSILAQMGLPDMRVPIRYALTCPDRPLSQKNYFDFERWSPLTFEPPDRKRFPAISLGFKAAGLGGIAGAVLNGANEAAVALFLEGKITFDAIPRTVGSVLDNADNIESPSLDQVLEADRWAREETRRCF